MCIHGVKKHSLRFLGLLLFPPTTVPTPPDWTVLIAVVCSIGGFALLVLLILGIIFCIKHRKKKRKTLFMLILKELTQYCISKVTNIRVVPFVWGWDMLKNNKCQQMPRSRKLTAFFLHDILLQTETVFESYRVA